MLNRIPEASPIETKEEFRKRILSDPDQFFEEWPTHYSEMERRGRKALWRRLGEAAVLVRVAQERPEILQRIPADDKTDLKNRRYQQEVLVQDVVYLLMKPKGKDEITKASKYTTAIRFLLSQEIEEEEFVTLLRRMGGIESVCKKARRKGICEIKQESDSAVDAEVTETKDDRFPELDKNFLEKLTHVDMGADATRLYEAKTITVRLSVKHGLTRSSWKDIKGKIIEIEE